MYNEFFCDLNNELCNQQHKNNPFKKKHVFLLFMHSSFVFAKEYQSMYFSKIYHALCSAFKVALIIFYSKNKHLI